jgi:hypothetical protein
MQGAEIPCADSQPKSQARKPEVVEVRIILLKERDPLE